MKNPEIRAWGVTIGFALVGIFAFFFLAPDTHIVWPDTLFYAVIVFNTFFSVRLFARVTPPSFWQTIVDSTLVLSYVALALAIGREWAFPFFALCIFIAAVAKYTLMLRIVPHEKLLKRKITIDILGVALCTVTLGIALTGWILTSAWFLAAVFTLSNVYLLLIRPMYRM